MKNKTIVKVEKDKNFKPSKNWQLIFVFLFLGGASILSEFIYRGIARHSLQIGGLQPSLSIGLAIICTSFIIITLLLSNCHHSMYGITGSDLLTLRTSKKQLGLSTQMLISASSIIWAVLFTFLSWSVALIAISCMMICFVCFYLHRSIRLCYDKKYMMERVQRLVDLSFYGASNLEERYMIELLTSESIKNAKNGRTQYLISDLNLLLYMYTHTEQLSMKQLIDTKLEYLTLELLPILPLQLISNEILKKLEDLNNTEYTKIALLITKEFIQAYATCDHATLTEQNIFSTLYTLFRPITEKAYLENLSSTLLTCEDLIEGNNQLTPEQKEYWILSFYQTLTAFKYLPETLKSLNFTCLIGVILKKLALSNTEHLDLLLTAIQQGEEDSKNMTTYLIACVHVLLYAYDKKYHIPNIKDLLVTLPSIQVSLWSDFESHLQQSNGIYLKYYDKIMEQIRLIATNTNEPTLVTYANEFFLYYWFLQVEKNYSIRYDLIENNGDNLKSMIDVIDYTEQQQFAGVDAFQAFYALPNVYDPNTCRKIIDYTRSEYTKYIYDRQREMQNQVVAKGIDKICIKINNHILNHLNEVPFAKQNLNINEHNTYTLKFLITNEDLLPDHLDDLVTLVNATYQQTMMKQLTDSLSKGLELKPFYYREKHENLSYITGWLDNFNCDCRSKCLTQNIEVLDNEKETEFRTFEKREHTLIDVSSVGFGTYTYLNSDKINIFNCPLSTSIRELSQSELNKLLDENKQGDYYQIENFLSDKMDATDYYLLTYKMLEVTYSMETIIEARAGFEVLFGVDHETTPQTQEEETSNLDNQPLANQTTLDSLLSDTTKK